MFVFGIMTLVADQPVEIPAYEITALQRRQAIKSGHLEISLETFFKKKKKGDVNRSSLLAVWFDGEKKRCDDIDGGGSGTRRIECFRGPDVTTEHDAPLWKKWLSGTNRARPR